MIQRRAVSSIVAGLIALVAILGTTIYFMSGNTIIPQNLNQPQEQESTQPMQNSPSTSQSTQTQTPVVRQESIRLSNVHSWVSSNGQAVTAFAIQNTGSDQNSINRIALRGIAVPQSNWYYCNPVECGTSTNVNTELTPDFNPENGVNLASGMTSFTTGSISLESGQRTIVYLKNAGSLQLADAGNIYSLQIQVGQATAVQQVQVITN